MPARRVPIKGAEHIMGATVETRDPLAINDMGNRKNRALAAAEAKGGN